MRTLFLFVWVVASVSGTVFGDNASDEALKKLQGTWKSGCVWQVESGWGSSQVFGLVTTVTFKGDQIERKMEYHADEETCEDRAKATLTLTSQVSQIAGKLDTPASGAKLDEKVVGAKLSVPTEYGTRLFGQLVGGLAIKGHCLYDIRAGKTYDVVKCSLGAIGNIPAVGTTLYDRVGQKSDTVWFPERERMEGSGEQFFRVITGVNKYQGAVKEAKREKYIDEDRVFARQR